MNATRYVLNVSRPRFWLYLGGTYLVGFAFGMSEASDLASPIFAVHLLYFLVPANIFLYGINDLFDTDTDSYNPKKGREEHRLRDRELGTVRIAVVASAILGLAIAAFQSTIVESSLVATFLALGAAYSVPPARLKARPILDFASNVLYAMPGFLGFVHASGHLPPTLAIIGAAAWTGAMHLFSAIPDIEADRAAGLSTTATVLGGRGSLALCSGLWSVAAMSAVALASEYGTGIAIVVAVAASVYPGISLSLMLAPDRVPLAYWRFPMLNAVLGFGLFLLAILA